MITLQTLPSVTDQEIFDQVVRRLLLKGKCPNHLLNDDETNSTNLTYPNLHAELIRALQNIHDASQPNTWVEQFKVIALKFHLKYIHDAC